MKPPFTFLIYIIEDVLVGIPGITWRSMFGGYVIYKEGLVFAIILDGQAYFKTDKDSKVEYEKYGSTPFTYTTKNGKKTMMNYWTLPEEIMEDRDLVREWVDRAVEISVKMKSKASIPLSKNQYW